MMDKQHDEKLRKANRRVALILGMIAVAALVYTFITLPKILAGAGG
ncbi:hypothetical protein J9253_17885 [Thiothrix litoralis]|jgi:hypothetical protein|uniref:Protoheme IX farnesyltransferase n=1 Tax=Thiothrix litoralis TaxID=2891210 RepID=A0ABX7WRI4_9GAMM|nr:hypothetical protein [Thiothrix litoralis]QTR45837.1 hypothetical protein J9253_17885 [Thiothrix litoralis]